MKHVARLGITVALLYSLGAAGACSNKDTAEGQRGDLPAGEECTSDDQCASGHCTNSICDYECLGDSCIAEGGAPGSAGGGEEEVDEGRARALRDSACTGWGGEAEPQSPILMFVVDVSSSMNQPDPSDTAQTKWAVTQPVLLAALDDLPDSVAVGLLLFPNQKTSASQVERPSSACVQDSAIVSIDVLGEAGSEQRQALGAALDMTPPSDSGTPTHDALAIALDELNRTSISGSRYVVLLTDGQPTYSLNCVGDGLPEHAVNEQPIIDEIRSALGDAIGTFVIGAPGSEKTVKVDDDARPWLSEAAEAGGTPQPDCSLEGDDYCHFDMVAKESYSEGLTQALLEIAEQVIPCDYGLPTPPSGKELDLDKVNVIFSPSQGSERLILMDDQPTCDKGWFWSEDKTRVLLCPDTCRELRLDRESKLDVLFGCETEVKLE